ncbi:Zinc finger protein ZAT2 [Cardamine amara subsp. amara]|uniref:Zinc finger protein ZAT2 n=1 Tax=Cardamine amara subsp. amara TaxID=228776 RepID=A0ABD1C2K5_CARAN
MMRKQVGNFRSNRIEDDNEIQCLLDLSIKESSFMTEIEEREDEMNEAAMSLVMFSEKVYDFDLPDPGDDDQLKPMEEKILDCVEWILELRAMNSHSGFEKSRTCNGVVAQALPSPLRSELTQSNSSHKCKKCGKIFGCYQALGGHQRLHRSTKGKLARKKDDNSLVDSLEAKKTSNFEVSEEEKILDCVDLKQDFSEPLLLNSKLKKRPESSSSYKCNICGKMFLCFQALGGHKTLHRSIKGKLPRSEDDNLLSHSSEAKKIVSQPLGFEVSQEEKILHCVDSKQDFNEQLFHSGFDKSSGCSQTSFSALPSTQSKSSYDCKICGKIFRCSQALGSHQRTHRRIKEQLASKRKYTEDSSSLSHSSEAKKIVSQPSSFEVSEEEKMLHCVETKQDFSELVSHSGFNKPTKTSFSALLSTARSTLQEKTQSNCQICGKSFMCSQALGSHQRIHRQISEQLARKRKYTEYCNSLSDSLEAKKIVSQPLSFEVSEEEKMLHCVESKQDFSELVCHTGFDNSNSCSKTSSVHYLLP